MGCRLCGRRAVPRVVPQEHVKDARVPTGLLSQLRNNFKNCTLSNDESIFSIVNAKIPVRIVYRSQLDDSCPFAYSKFIRSRFVICKLTKYCCQYVDVALSYSSHNPIRPRRRDRMVGPVEGPFSLWAAPLRTAARWSGSRPSSSACCTTCSCTAFTSPPSPLPRLI